MSIQIEQITLKQIQHHLETSYPFEACGFILGTEEDGIRTVIKSIVSENESTDNQRRFFVINALDYLKAEKIALRENLQLLGIYHSHPDHPAIPSAHDLEFAQPFFSYLIFSIESNKMVDERSYRLSNGVFKEEVFSIIELQPNQI